MPAVLEFGSLSLAGFIAKHDAKVEAVGDDHRGIGKVISNRGVDDHQEIPIRVSNWELFQLHF